MLSSVRLSSLRPPSHHPITNLIAPQETFPTPQTTRASKSTSSKTHQPRSASQPKRTSPPDAAVLHSSSSKTLIAWRPVSSCTTTLCLMTGNTRRGGLMWSWREFPSTFYYIGIRAYVKLVLIDAAVPVEAENPTTASPRSRLRTRNWTMSVNAPRSRWPKRRTGKVATRTARKRVILRLPETRTIISQVCILAGGFACREHCIFNILFVWGWFTSKSSCFSLSLFASRYPFCAPCLDCW